MPRLDRFKTAQDQTVGGFDSALAELRAGGKRGHWIWYVFPQLSGLGSSGMSQVYGIDGSSEAADYLRDPVLRGRLLAIARTAAEQLSQGISIDQLMGSPIDAVKLVSSMTLFGRVARRLHEVERLEGCDDVAELAEGLLAAAEQAGYPPCQLTLRRLAGQLRP